MCLLLRILPWKNRIGWPAFPMQGTAGCIANLLAGTVTRTPFISVGNSFFY